jgi:hypothetical protein
MEKVSPEPNSGCWLWTGCVSPAGYGQLKLGGAGAPVLYAHRTSYQMHKGEIPKGHFVCHKCDVRSCVNPDHLFVGTHSQNMRDCVDKNRHQHGVRHFNAVMTEEKVAYIRSSVKLQSELAREFSVCQQTISDIKNRKTWKHVA